MKKFGLAILPAALGLVAALVWQAGWLPNEILYWRADVGTTMLGLGVVLSLAFMGGIAIQQWSQHGVQDAIERAQTQEIDAHRRFLRRLDHEIKNPLTAIRAALANLDGRDDNPRLTSVRAQVDRLAKLGTDLRKLTDLETQPLEKDNVDPGQLLTELVLLMRERPDAARCQVHLTLPQAPWPLPFIVGDRDLLFLAFHNLVDNALKFSTQDAKIEVRAFEDGPSVVMQVADTGPGIGEDELPHLGEELYRGSAGRSVEGSGLGLALVQSIVNRHQGTIEIRSRVGQGTVVTLRFPAAK
ncbi:MAG: HAMP domain-containing histidine kinase [Chloroflexi bacterium]|nr:HAMP domain-containing histidine kinase [Chloroflexota bacterium]